MTYTALCNLRILGDDLSRVNRRALIGALSSLQQADGSFSSTRLRSESDMRFLYCACSISAMLGDWSGFDVERSIGFIRASQSYDGGIGLWPGCEGHGGSTYCAVASLVLMNQSVRTHLRLSRTLTLTRLRSLIPSFPLCVSPSQVLSSPVSSLPSEVVSV
jgi:geranylgeranyl transferase type-1 subunit beta